MCFVRAAVFSFNSNMVRLRAIAVFFKIADYLSFNSNMVRLRGF